MHHVPSPSRSWASVATAFFFLFSCFAVSSTVATSYEAAPFTQVHAPTHPVLRLRRGYKPFDKRSLQLPADTQPRHDDTFLLKFEVDSEPFSVVFRPATTLIHPSAKVNLHADAVSQHLNASDVRAYEGTVLHEDLVEQYWAEEVAGLIRPWEDKQRGWARLLLRQDEAWDGSMQVEGVRYHFKPVHAYLRDARKRAKRSGLPMLDPPLPALARRNLLGGNTVVLRSVDTQDDTPETASCSHDRSPFNLQTGHQLATQRHAPLVESRSFPVFQRDSDSLELMPAPALVRRQDIAGSQGNSSFQDSIGSGSGCPKERRVVYIGVAADCNAVQEFGDQDEARTQMLSLINSVSGVYTDTFNVSIGVVELNVQNSSCPSTTSSDEPWNVACNSNNAPALNDRLSLFSEWRGNKGGSDGAGLWHLITTCTSGCM